MGTVVQSAVVLHCFPSRVPLCSIKWRFKVALMFQASFLPNANFSTDTGQEIVRADSLPDTWTRCFLWRKSLQLRLIRLPDCVILCGEGDVVEDVHFISYTACFIFLSSQTSSHLNIRPELWILQSSLRGLFVSRGRGLPKIFPPAQEMNTTSIQYEVKMGKSDVGEMKGLRSQRKQRNEVACENREQRNWKTDERRW